VLTKIEANGAWLSLIGRQGVVYPRPTDVWGGQSIGCGGTQVSRYLEPPGKWFRYSMSLFGCCPSTN